jgi:hypothetical protein
MSAFGGKADITQASENVRFWSSAFLAAHQTTAKIDTTLRVGGAGANRKEQMISRAFCATKIENRVDNKFASSERHNLSEKCGPNLLGVRGMGIGDRGRALCGRTAPIYIGSGVSAINI